MAGDLQVGLGFGPGFREQPYPAPEPAPVHQLGQPDAALMDYADTPSRPVPGAAVRRSQRLGREPQAAGGYLPVKGVFHPGPKCQGKFPRGLAAPMLTALCTDRRRLIFILHTWPRLGHDQFPGKAHGRPPTSGFVTATKMPDSRALSKLSDQFHSIHTPVRDGEGDAGLCSSTGAGGRGEYVGEYVQDQRLHSPMFHSSLSQPLIRTPLRLWTWADTMPRFTNGIS